MTNIFYTLIFISLLVQISGCGDFTPVETYEIKLKPELSLDEITALRASFEPKVKAARDKTCRSYYKRDTSPVSYAYSLFVIKLRNNNRHASHALNDPLTRHSDVLCALEPRNAQPVFMPNISLNAGHTIRYPAQDDELPELIEALRAGFILGHPLVGLMLASTGHQIMGAFKQTGEFVIVDSMGGGLINAQDLAIALNKAKIVDSDGFLIKFSGTSIGTRLQKGGNDCIRLAALYLRQILKDNDLEAYQKVNGAFVDGILQRFEDIALIDNARKVAVVEPTIERQRDQFMYSWDHRNHSMFHDRGWEGITVGELRPRNAGGKEADKSDLVVWTNFNGDLWDSKIDHICNGGIRYCLSRNRDQAVFSSNFNDLDDVRREANNGANPRVNSITNLNESIGRVLDPHHNRIGLLYVKATNEFFAIELDNGFIEL